MQEPVRIIEMNLCNAIKNMYNAFYTIDRIKKTYSWSMGSVSELSDKTRCLRASAATYLAFREVRGVRCWNLFVGGPDKPKCELTRVEYSFKS